MRWAALGGIAVLLILIVLVIAGGGGGTAPGTTVLGIDMEGTPAEVQKALQRRAAELLRREVRVTAGGGTVAAVSPAGVGGSVDVDAAIRAAEAASPNRLVRGLRAITGLSAREVPVPVIYGTGSLAAWSAEVAAGLDRPGENAVVTVDGTTFTVTPARPGREVDRRALESALVGDLAALPGETLLPIHETQPALTTGLAQAQVQEAGQVLARGSSVVVDGVQATLPPADVARAMRVTAAGLRIAASDLQRPLHVAFPQGTVPRPAHFDIRGARVILVPSRSGRLVDGGRVAAGLLGDDRPVQSEFVDVTPTFTTGKAKELGIKEEVGSYTTAYDPGQPRVTNIQRAAHILNGTIIPPGGTLSLNTVLGKRTADRGFVPAPMVADGLVVDAVGGGVSQLATTLFNAAFVAGFRLDEHRSHQLYFERYPTGRDATISWPKPDLRVTNNWPAAALVRVFAGSSGVTVAIYSTSFDRRVETETSEPYDRTKPKTRRITSPDLKKGKKALKSRGAPGFSVTVTRRVYEGALLKEDGTFETVYLAPPRLILVAEGTPGAETPAEPQ